jgi:hypothetical protein
MEERRKEVVPGVVGIILKGARTREQGRAELTKGEAAR